MKERGDEDVVEKLVCTARAIWHNQNVTRHGGQRRNGKELVRWVAQYMEEYKEANKGTDSTVTIAKARDTWSPPPVNLFKAWMLRFS